MCFFFNLFFYLNVSILKKRRGGKRLFAIILITFFRLILLVLRKLTAYQTLSHHLFTLPSLPPNYFHQRGLLPNVNVSSTLSKHQTIHLHHLIHETIKRQIPIIKNLYIQSHLCVFFSWVKSAITMYSLDQFTHSIYRFSIQQTQRRILNMVYIELTLCSTLRNLLSG